MSVLGIHLIKYFYVQRNVHACLPVATLKTH